MSRILHITRRADWAAAQAAGQYTAPSLQSEGFIHFSTAEQVIAVANSFYAGQVDLVLLSVDTVKLTAPLKWEPPIGLPPPGGVTDQPLFPHLYGPLNLSAVVVVINFPPGGDGRFELPEELR
jgi:uncharacterized protein (DUF952 family)